ncbi:MAG: UDP-N-acetylmuramyl-tripeptide synthetase [Patescibacteria group bacterium]|nr:UDP-N-acetylmuramyl-tripeptide synthetase [Patescibacteria group bacterium]
MALNKIFRKIAPYFLVSAYHFAWAFFGALLCGFPSRKLFVIGITGTNGKSTTVLMICRILEEAGFKVGSVSSLWVKIGQKEQPNPWHMTMPGRFSLQKLMRQMAKEGCHYAVLEVTSEGVLQSRHKFINFQAAVLSNLSAEHIERHGSFEKYREAKGKFFAAVKGTHIINADDENAEYFLQFSAKQKLLFSLNPKILNTPLLRSSGVLSYRVVMGTGGAENVEEKNGQLSFNVDSVPFVLPLMGKFNVYNSLAAICVGVSQGISLEICQKALAKIGQIAGRMEIVQKEPFLVIVDLAHTPPALEKVYQTCQAMLGPGNKIIAVFGAAGGGRDKWKRPELGHLAARYCGAIVLTNEDPYDESPTGIINQIAEGMQGVKLLARCKEFNSLRVFKILDRRGAIKKGLELARPGDIVLLLGKGTEATMVFENGRKIAWNEKKVVEESLNNINL